jgi:hypothetical protein
LEKGVLSENEWNQSSNGREGGTIGHESRKSRTAVILHFFLTNKKDLSFHFVHHKHPASDTWKHNPGIVDYKNYFMHALDERSIAAIQKQWRL